MKYRNCCNCGAPLQFNKSKTEKYIECAYCGTQYELSDDNEIKDYTIELTVNGKKRKFYLSNLEYNKLFSDARRDSCGILHGDVVAEKYKLELVEV